MQISGWLYFFTWSLSFYPQFLLNWRKKSVVGLSLDYVSLNVMGFICYSIFNIAFFFDPGVQEQYRYMHAAPTAHPSSCRRLASQGQVPARVTTLTWLPFNKQALSMPHHSTCTPHNAYRTPTQGPWLPHVALEMGAMCLSHIVCNTFRTPSESCSVDRCVGSL